MIGVASGGPPPTGLMFGWREWLVRWLRWFQCYGGYVPDDVS